MQFNCIILYCAAQNCEILSTKHSLERMIRQCIMHRVCFILRQKEASFKSCIESKALFVALFFLDFFRLSYSVDVHSRRLIGKDLKNNLLTETEFNYSRQFLSKICDKLYKQRQISPLTRGNDGPAAKIKNWWRQRVSKSRIMDQITEQSKYLARDSNFQNIIFKAVIYSMLQYIRISLMQIGDPLIIIDLIFILNMPNQNEKLIPIIIFIYYTSCLQSH